MVSVGSERFVRIVPLVLIPVSFSLAVLSYVRLEGRNWVPVDRKWNRYLLQSGPIIETVFNGKSNSEQSK